MSTKTLGQLGLALVLLGAAAALWWRSSPRNRIDLNPYTALGAVAGEEVTKALLNQSKGGIVVVIPAPGPDPDPVLDSQLRAFTETLRQQGPIPIEATETVTMDPFLRMRTGGAIPLDQFEAIRSRHTAAAAIVLFIGFPPLSEEERSALRGSPQQLMVISAALPGYDVLLREGILRFAIVPRTVPADAALPPANSLRETFDQEYIVLRRPEPGG